jgi:hypothetical protein
MPSREEDGLDEKRVVVRFVFTHDNKRDMEVLFRLIALVALPRRHYRCAEELQSDNELRREVRDKTGIMLEDARPLTLGEVHYAHELLSKYKFGIDNNKSQSNV